MPPPEQQFLDLKNVARYWLRILRLEHDLRVILNKAFDECVTIYHCDHDVAVKLQYGSAKHKHVPIKNIDTHNTLAIGAH